MHPLGMLFNTFADASFYIYIYNFIASHKTFDSVLFKQLQQTVSTIIKLNLGGRQGTEGVRNTNHKCNTFQNYVIVLSDASVQRTLAYEGECMKIL